MKILIVKLKMWKLNKYICKTQSDMKIDTYELNKQYNRLVSTLNRLKNRRVEK